MSYALNAIIAETLRFCGNQPRPNAETLRHHDIIIKVKSTPEKKNFRQPY